VPTSQVANALDPEIAALQRSYRRRRKVTIVLFAVAFLYWLLLLFRLDAIQRGITGYFYVWLGLVLVVGIVSYIVWRCPRCGAGFGRRFRVDRCSECQLPLEFSART
jgi:hypothetical protein